MFLVNLFIYYLSAGPVQSQHHIGIAICPDLDDKQRLLAVLLHAFVKLILPYGGKFFIYLLITDGVDIFS
jgi:hypothetical protein